MAPYQYLPLTDGSVDIRLVTLLPGNFDDDIRLKISHAPLIRPVETIQQKMTLKELKKTIPPHCRVFENLEGRFIFQQEDEDGYGTNSWTHPDLNFDQQRYFPSPDDSASRFEPAFEALSYCWGSVKKLESVFVERRSSISSVNGPITEFDDLSITESLCSALKHIRPQNGTRTVWIDAICINQQDEAERSAQIMRMRDIYKFARRVVIWLGPESKDSKLALETLEYLGVQVECSKDTYGMESPDTTEEDWFHPLTVLPYTAEQWDAIHDLMARPWFGRLWVCQEAHLANPRATMQCGMYECLWSRFLRAVCAIRVKQQPLSTDLRGRAELIHPLAPYVEQPLLDVLDMSRSKQCSDERDRVYGLLGLMPLGCARSIFPDYSLSAGTVMKDLFLIYLHQTSRLDMLEFCDPLVQHVDGTTWVPRLVHRGYHIYSLGINRFSAGHSRAEWGHSLSTTLDVTGIRCATVSNVSVSGPEDLVECLKVIRGWEPQELLSKPYITGGSLFDAYSLTLVANHVKERCENGPAFTLQQYKDMVRTRLCQSGDLYSDTDVCEPAIGVALTHSRGRSFLTTKEGHIGLGPGAAQPGRMHFRSLF